MKFDKDTKILIVGLGLIGGSYAEALSSGGYEVGAIDCNADSIAFALEKGWISSGRDDTDGEYIGKFDLIVFALYPHIFIDWIKQNQRFIRPGALLTDVTGVKCSVVYEVQKLLRSDLEFIGAHPMAGREVSGVRNAKKEIFTDANYIVTPTESNTLEAIAACKALGRAIGFKNISTLTPEKHDDSRLPLSPDPLHSRGADDIKGIGAYVRIHGRLIPRPDEDSQDKRRDVERAFHAE